MVPQQELRKGPQEKRAGGLQLQSVLPPFLCLLKTESAPVFIDKFQTWRFLGVPDFPGSNGRRESQGSLSSGASLELGTSASGKNEVSPGRSFQDHAPILQAGF